MKPYHLLLLAAMGLATMAAAQTDRTSRTKRRAHTDSVSTWQLRPDTARGHQADTVRSRR